MEKKKKGKKRRERKKGVVLKSKPYSHQKPKESQGEPKVDIISSSISKGLLENSKKIIRRKKAQLQNLLQAFQAATSDNKGLSYSCFLSYLFLYWLVGYPVKPLRFLVSL